MELVSHASEAIIGLLDRALKKAVRSKALVKAMAIIRVSGLGKNHHHFD